MKHPLSHRLVLTLAVTAAGFTSGCASLNEALWMTNDALQQQQQAMAYHAYMRDYYGPRPSSDTSAPGIK